MSFPAREPLIIVTSNLAAVGPWASLVYSEAGISYVAWEPSSRSHVIGSSIL